MASTVIRVRVVKKEGSSGWFFHKVTTENTTINDVYEDICLKGNLFVLKIISVSYLIPGGGALPYVGGYQVLVNRLLYFTPTLHPMTPFFFYSVHTQ